MVNYFSSNSCVQGILQITITYHLKKKFNLLFASDPSLYPLPFFQQFKRKENYGIVNGLLTHIQRRSQRQCRPSTSFPSGGPGPPISEALCNEYMTEAQKKLFQPGPGLSNNEALNTY